MTSRWPKMANTLNSGSIEYPVTYIRCPQNIGLIMNKEESQGGC